MLEKDKAEKDSYGGMAQKLPVLIRTAGLCQALYFVRSRKTPVVRETLLGHLAEQLQRVDPAIQNVDSLLDRVRSAPLGTYLWLSREALATIEWYSRLSQSELDVDRTDSESDPS
jgi:CRISPR-associated protein Cmr5